MWPTRAAVEPGVDACPLERVLDQAEVLARRSQEHGDLVEPHASADFLENPTRDLHALAPFAGGREELDVSERLTCGWLPAGEERSPQRGQIRVAGRLECLDRGLEPLEMVERREIAEGDGDERLRRRRDQVSRQLELDRRLHGDVEQEERKA